jgi:hypothetical protein
MTVNTRSQTIKANKHLISPIYYDVTRFFLVELSDMMGKQAGAVSSSRGARAS